MEEKTMKLQKLVDEAMNGGNPIERLRNRIEELRDIGEYDESLTEEEMDEIIDEITYLEDYIEMLQVRLEEIRIYETIGKPRYKEDGTPMNISALMLYLKQMKKEEDELDFLNTSKVCIEEAKPFLGCEEREEFLEVIQELTTNELSKLRAKHKGIGYAIARLNYLVNCEIEEKEALLEEEYFQGTLIPYLLEAGEAAMKFYEMEYPRMMKSWGLTEELRMTNEEEYQGLLNNMKMQLKRMTLEMMVYQTA